jgi:hypothetical protein
LYYQGGQDAHPTIILKKYECKLKAQQLITLQRSLHATIYQRFQESILLLQQQLGFQATLSTSVCNILRLPDIVMSRLGDAYATS